MMNKLKILLSLLAPAWVLLLSTSIPLYLKNQSELYYRYEALYPFLWGALLIWLLAIVFFFWSRKNKFIEYFIWGYYLLIPLFLVYNAMLKDNSIFWLQLGGSLLLLSLFLWLVIVLKSKFSLQSIHRDSEG